MAHKRNGHEAKARRQELAKARHSRTLKFGVCLDQEHHVAGDSGYFDPRGHAISEERFLEISLPKNSVFYDEVAEDHITIKDATMYAGIDY